MTHDLDPITVSRTASLVPGALRLDDSLALIDNLGVIPVPGAARRVRCLLLALCTAGTADYTVDAQPFTAGAGDLVVISPGRVLDRCRLGQGCAGWSLFVDYDFFLDAIKGVPGVSQLFLFANRYPVFRLPAGGPALVQTYLGLMRDKLRDTRHHFRRQTVRSLLTTLIYDLGDTLFAIQLREEQNPRAEEIFTRFLRLVELHFRHERSMQWYGEKMCLSPKYLSETVKAVSRITATEWIDRYLVQEMCALLKSTDKSIKELAILLGFPNQSFFAKYFREHVGCTPSDYRRR